MGRGCGGERRAPFCVNARETIDALCVRPLNILGRRPWPSCGGRSAGWHETKQEDPWGCRRPRRRWWWQRPWRPKAPDDSGRRAGRAVDLLRVRRGLGGTERVRVTSRSPHPIPPFLLRPAECQVCLLTRTTSSLHPHSDRAGFRSSLASLGLRDLPDAFSAGGFPVGPGFSQAVPSHPCVCH